jgi:tRNA pseudouridine-54 N-methylase
MSTYTYRTLVIFRNLVSKMRSLSIATYPKFVLSDTEGASCSQMEPTNEIGTTSYIIGPLMYLNYTCIMCVMRVEERY